MLISMRFRVNITRKEMLILGKNNKLKSWGEMIKLNNRAFKIFYKRYPQMFLSRFISVIWRALTPYIGIYLSALIIDELAGSRNVERLRFLVLLHLVLLL